MGIYPYEKGGKEHWYYAFEVKDRKGKRKTIKQRGFTGKTAAREAERDARVAWKKGQRIDPSTMEFGDYITDWLEHKQDISPETRYTNEGHLKNHIIPELGGIKLQEVNVSDIKNFIKTLQNKEVINSKGERKKIASGTVKKIFNLVQTCFKTAVTEEIILRNPFDLLDMSSKPKVEKVKIDYWTREEVITFFGKLDHRLRILFILAIYTGMRRGEITGLRWKDIDFDNARLTIRQTLKPSRVKDGGKNVNASRSISISPNVLNELKVRRSASIKERWAAAEMCKSEEELKVLHDRFEKNDFVVCNPDGNPVSLGNFNKFWKGIIRRTGMRYIRFHDLRHTCASLLLGTGVHPKIVQELLGHSSIKVTLDTYSHLLPNMQKDALEELDKLLK